MTAGQPVQTATNQLLNIQKQQAGTQQPNIPVSASPNQNIVINNKTENITRNKVYVPANIGGPIQGRPIQFKKVEEKGEQDLGKFKSWLNNKIARQNDISEARQREYRKRNTNLEKTESKLSRVLKDFGRRIDASLERNNVKGIGLSLKGVFLLIGLGKLAKNWQSTMNTISKIEKRITRVFRSLKRDAKDGFSKNGRLQKAFVKLFGGKEGETVGQALRRLLFDKDSGILGYIRKLISNRLKERSEAISKIEKPNLSLGDALKFPSKAIEKIANYLSDILSAILNPEKVTHTAVVNAANKQEEKYAEDNNYEIRKITTHQFSKGFLPKGVTVSENDRAIIKGTYNGLKAGALDNSGNLTDFAGSYASQSADIKRNINLASSAGQINTASVGLGFQRLHKASQEKDVIPVTRDFVETILPKKEDRENIGIMKPVFYDYIVRPKTPTEMAIDLAGVAKDDEEIMKFLKGAGLLAGTIASGLNPLGAGLGYGIGDLAGELGLYIDQKNIPRYTTELRKPGEERKEGEYITSEHPLVYELNKEQIEKLIEEFTGKSGLEVNIDNKEFLSAIDAKLRNIAGGNKNVQSSQLGDIDNLFSVSDMVEQHREEEKNFLDNSRMTAASENGHEAMQEIGGYFRETYDNAKKAWNSVDEMTDEEWEDYEEEEEKESNNNADSDGKDESTSIWDKAKNAWNNIKEWRSSSAPSVSSIEGIDRVVELSKTGLFYSNSSDSAGEGRKGPWSKHGHGYIPLTTHPKYQGKCTSGPATFYHDALGINLNSHWWNTGKPYTATGTNIGQVGFKKVWWGDKEQGYNKQAVENTGFKLEKGDIMLNFVGGLKVSNSHPGGKSAHAQMWNGEQWVSDTYQGDRSWPYGSGSKGRLGNESCQIWRLDSVANSQTANASKSEVSTPTSTTPSINLNELANNSATNLQNYSVDSVGISNFEPSSITEPELASVSMTTSNSNSDLKEQYEKVVSIAYNSLDNIAEKLKLVIKNESIHVATTNDISDQV